MVEGRSLFVMVEDDYPSPSFSARVGREANKWGGVRVKAAPVGDVLQTSGWAEKKKIMEGQVSQKN